MPRLERRKTETTYSSAETAVILSLAAGGPGAPVTKRAVDGVIDKRLLPPAVVRRAKGTRALTATGVTIAAAELRLRRELPIPALRKRVYERMARGASKGPVRASAAVTVDVARPLAEARKALGRYRKLMRHIVADPRIQRGEPVIRGTRVTAHTIAEIARDTPVAEILRHYPSLTAEQVEAARLYAQAHPRRGRPSPSKAPIVFEANAADIARA